MTAPSKNTLLSAAEAEEMVRVVEERMSHPLFPENGTEFCGNVLKTMKSMVERAKDGRWQFLTDKQSAAFFNMYNGALKWRLDPANADRKDNPVWAARKGPS